jgi:membrane-bound serine protease (ClpP class)
MIPNAMVGELEWVQALGPDVFYLAMIAGIWLAVTAIYVPGTGFPEVGALVGLLVGLFGVIALPGNLIGLLFLILALGCFASLVFFRHLWPLIVLGMLFQVVGSIFLFRVGERPHLLSIVLVNVATLAYHQIVLRPGLRIQDALKRMDVNTLIGEEGEVVVTIDPIGTVRLHGELWSARAEQAVGAGQQIRVVDREGLQLKVVPAEHAPAPSNNR